MDLFKRSLKRDELQRALGFWRWLDVGSLVPMWASHFGAIFLNGRDGWWFLDPYDGEITRRWRSHAELTEALTTDDGAERYLARSLVEGATAKGLTCGPDEILSYEVFPIFGAPADLDNIAVRQFQSVHGFAGQFHAQTQPGDKVSHITIDGRIP